MAAIHSCPDCPLHQKADSLAELAQYRDQHRDLNHASLSRSDDRGQQAGR